MVNDPAPTQPDLRWYLREGTRGAHDEVDRSFSCFDLTLRRDYVKFLMAHHAALTTLPLSEPLFDLPSVDLLDPLRADLLALDAVPTPCLAAKNASASFRLGCYYVVAGAQAGAKLLKLQQAQSSDAAVRAASAYLDAAANGTCWARFRTFQPAGNLVHTDVLAGALFAFRTFHEAAQAQAQTLHEPTAPPAPFGGVPTRSATSKAN